MKNKHLIVPNYGHKVRSKHTSDCYAIARAIHNYSNTEKVVIAHGMDFKARDYTHIWHMRQTDPNYGPSNAQYIRVLSNQLYWWKFGWPYPPIYSSKTEEKYDILFTGSNEPGRALDLLNNSKFTSASFGSGTDSKIIKGHRCHQPIGYAKMSEYINYGKVILIMRGGISHCLVEALYYDKLVLIDRKSDYHKALGFSDWHYVGNSGEIRDRVRNIPDNQLQKQQEVKNSIWSTIKNNRLNVPKFLNHKTITSRGDLGSK